LIFAFRDLISEVDVTSGGAYSGIGHCLLEETRLELFGGETRLKIRQTCFVTTTVNSSLNSSVGTFKFYFFHFLTKKKREAKLIYVEY
jgi:hypothetical protein